MIAAIHSPQATITWGDQFSPIVGLEHETLLLDITGLPFNAEQVARMLDARVAVAETVGKAWALAHYDEPLPIESLRLPAETVALLSELGLDRVTDLQALPRDRLAARFPAVVERLDQFMGLLAEPIRTCRQPPEIVVKRDLEYPIERQDMIEFVVAQAIEQVAAELASRQQGAIRLCVALDGVEFMVGLFQPSASSRYLRELAQMQLERVKIAGPVSRVQVSVLLSARLQTHQRELFGDSFDRQRQLALFVDRVSCRALALRAVLVPDAQPEHAFRYEPLTARKRTYRQQLTLRPLLVEPRPVAVEVISTAGRPAMFRLDGQQHRATRVWGPERIQTGWWRYKYIRRDYYRVETTTACYWLFCSQGKWFLHGVF